MEECYICFSSLKSSDFKLLPCSHKICFNCYLKLCKTECPLCREKFTYNKQELIKIKELGIKNKYNSPSIQQNYIERSRINDLDAINDHISNLHLTQPVRRSNRLNRFNDLNFEDTGIVQRQRYRKRRRNLSEDEIKERRKIIREKCRRKWLIKENRLNKINWYDINVEV